MLHECTEKKKRSRSSVQTGFLQSLLRQDSVFIFMVTFSSQTQFRPPDIVTWYLASNGRKRSAISEKGLGYKQSLKEAKIKSHQKEQLSNYSRIETC